MKRTLLGSLFLSILLLVTACSETPAQTESSSVPTTIPEAVKLLAEATGSLEVREYIAAQLALDSESDYPEISKEVFHSDEFYQLVADSLEDTRSLAYVQEVFGELPHAYLMGSGDVKGWDAVRQEPLVTHLFEGDDEEAETATVFDASLSTYSLPTDQKPDKVVLVLHEGVAEQSMIETQARVFCNEANHGETYTYRINKVYTKSRDVKDKQAVHQANYTAGWVLEDAVPILVKNRGGTYDHDMINAGEHFITLSELKIITDDSRKNALDLGLSKELEIKIEQAITDKYEVFKKFTTNEVTERTAIIDYETDDKFRLRGHRLIVDLLVTERCNSVEATTEEGTSKVFENETARVAAGKTETGKVTFSISPSELQASLRIVGKGTTKSSYHGGSLTLEPGTYTLSGSGYSTSQGIVYTAPNQTFTVAAGKSTTVSVYMHPQSQR